MEVAEYSLGQRLSLKGHNCIIRYFGSVGDKAGSWLGLEWDDASRGKHNGTYNGVAYFACTANALVQVSYQAQGG